MSFPAYYLSPFLSRTQVNPGIAIDKVTNGADGQTILEGSAVTWTYTVTNTGNVRLSNINLNDD